MIVEVIHIKNLLKAAVTKAHTNLSRLGMGKLSEAINEEIEGLELSQRYLDETIRRGILKAEKETKTYLRLDEAYVYAIAQYVGFIDLEEFRTAYKGILPNQLKACLGYWYNYVRDSSEKEHILRSPIHIYEEDNLILMKLHGYHRTFSGVLQLKSGCICCLLEDELKEKELHLVFKVGLSLNANVLKGVFSGLSSSGSPIAGREILVRQQVNSIKELERAKLNINSKDNFSVELDQRIIDYFKEFKSNYLKITDIRSFDLDDLLS